MTLPHAKLYVLAEEFKAKLITFDEYLEGLRRLTKEAQATIDEAAALERAAKDPCCTDQNERTAPQKNPSPIADAMQSMLDRWYAGELARAEIESFIRYGNLSDEERRKLGLEILRMTKLKDTRLQCPYCKVRTWQTDFGAFMRDHDRPDGRRCRRAARDQEEYAKRKLVSKK